MEMHRVEVVGIFLWYEEESLFEVRRLKKYSRRVSAILASGPLHASTRFHPLPQTTFRSLPASTQGSTGRNLLRSTSSYIFGQIESANVIITQFLQFNLPIHNRTTSVSMAILSPIWRLRPRSEPCNIMSRDVEKAARHGYYFRLMELDPSRTFFHGSTWENANCLTACPLVS